MQDVQSVLQTRASLIGHNRPPIDAASISADLQDEFSFLIKRRDDLTEAEGRIHLVEDEDTARKISDFIKQLTALAKAADGARVSAKEPFLEGGRAVDGFFHRISDPLLAVKSRVQEKLTTYLREKEALERAERLKREYAAREAAAMAAREAAAAERKLQDEKSLADAIEARKRSDQAEADRVKAQKEAEAKPADLSRVRGEYGAVASLRTLWTFKDIDRARLDLEALRPHLPSDGLDKAVRSFVKAGGRELAGCTIYESQDATVR